MSKKQTNGHDIDMADVMSKAMLVRLKKRCWSGKKNDSKVSAEIAKRHGSKKSMGRFVKTLIESPELAEIKAIFAAADAVLKRFTLPWDGGTRLLTTKVFWEYNEALEPIIREADPAFRKFLRVYKKQWETGMKEASDSLGTLFNAEDYPSPSVLKHRFGIRSKVMALTDENDFRVKLGAETTKAVRDQIAADIREDLKESMKGAYVRLFDLVSRIHERLDEPTTIFRDSLFESGEELLTMLTALNVTNDPDLTKMIEDIGKKVLITDFADTRTDLVKRSHVAKEAKKILRGMQSYIG